MGKEKESNALKGERGLLQGWRVPQLIEYTPQEMRRWEMQATLVLRGHMCSATWAQAAYAPTL